MINASEIADFVYCERSWWLAKRNYFGQLDAQEIAAAMAGLEAGSEYHQTYTKEVHSVSSQGISIRTLMIIVALVILAVVLFLLIGQAHGIGPKHKVLSPDHTSKSYQSVPNKASVGERAPWALIFLIYILPILILVVLFLRRSVHRRQKRWHMPEGRLVYVDDQDSAVLICHELGLAGKPDAVWLNASWYVPEERKSTILASGRAPFDNHVVQLAAYCYLVAKQYGPVQAGVISYANIRHTIPYNDAQYQRLVRTINRIRKLEAASEVHRSHQSAAKCRGCVAASMCVEALTTSGT